MEHQLGEKKIAVLLLNLGGPDSLEAVRPFLLNLFLDREIIRLPIQPLLARIIAWSRAKKVVERYQEIGGKSPLLELTKEQANALEIELNKIWSERHAFKVYIGMRYWHPFIEDTVKEIIQEGVKEIIALPLFPHYSRATTGSCLNELNRALKKLNGDVRVITIKSWYDHPAYLDALAEKIKESLDSFPKTNDGKVQVLFSAHSLPEAFVTEGDPYPVHLQRTIEGILERVGSLSWQLAFQSRSGPVKWLEPSTDEVLQKLAEQGHKAILMVPLSFVSDHVETLYEIDILFRDLAYSKGIVSFQRTPALNTSPKFITALVEIVAEALHKEDEGTSKEVGARSK